jgi:transcriptional regulator with XRE-family HTH domain
MKRFGEKLRTLRERRGLSYRRLGAELGYSYAHFARIEAGHTMPSAQLIVAIAEYFGVSFDELMDDKLELRKR